MDANMKEGSEEEYQSANGEAMPMVVPMQDEGQQDNQYIVPIPKIAEFAEEYKVPQQQPQFDMEDDEEFSIFERINKDNSGKEEAKVVEKHEPLDMMEFINQETGGVGDAYDDLSPEDIMRLIQSNRMTMQGDEL
jgi:hypothetical protein